MSVQATHNGGAPAPVSQPQFQTVILTLSDGRRGLFSGLALARPTEIELLNLHVAGCMFTEPGTLPPLTALPTLIAAIQTLREAVLAFEDRPTPDRGRMVAAAQDTVFDILDGAAGAATAAQDDERRNDKKLIVER
jgi:hypothetical protein